MKWLIRRRLDDESPRCRDLHWGLALDAGNGGRPDADHGRPERFAAEQIVGQGRHGAAAIVVNAHGASLQGQTLTLAGVSPTPIVFADRPVRAAGHLPTDALPEEWTTYPAPYPY
jgi:hypothetical protein